MTDYLVGLVGALGIADQRMRKEVASWIEKSLTTPEAEEALLLEKRLKEAISSYGRCETASGTSAEPLKALENAISAILLKEGRFFRSYAIVATVLSGKILSQSQLHELNKTMRRLAGRFTNIFIHPVESKKTEGYEVRLFSIGLHDMDRVK